MDEANGAGGVERPASPKGSDSQNGALQRFWGVIPAGGAGTRLWPLSRVGRPKFLLDLSGSGRSMLQATADRLAPLCGERLLVVTGQHHAAAIADQLPQLPTENIVAEPSPRESMPAIGLAAALLERRDPNAIIGSFAADHVITDEASFRRQITQAVAVADAGYLVTVGIKPQYPSTGFGYIQVGSFLPIDGAPDARQVTAFVEKPDAAIAKTYLAEGNYLWNAGMFVARAGVLLDLLARQLPELAAGLRAIAEDPSSLADRWPTLTKIVIDRAIAEPAAARGDVAVIPSEFGWDDVGDFASLGKHLREIEPGVRVLGSASQVLAQDATGVFVPGSGRLVAALGLSDVVVVDTDDAVLVTDLAHVQQVKSLVEDVGLRGRSDLR